MLVFRGWSSRLGRLREEHGLGLIEVMVGMMILTIGFFTLAGAIGLGFKQVGLGRQRQTSSEIASARIEHLRNVPYDRVSVRDPGDLGEAPLGHNSDPDNPDYWVTDGSPKLLDVDGADGSKPLESLIAGAGGEIDHIEDPVRVGATTMEIYQYASWVNDASIPGSQDYKRVTVVVKYKVPAITGVTKFVRVSALFTPETVSTDGIESTPNPGTSPEPDPSPSPSPSPSPGACAGDTAAPTGSISIVAGAGSEAGYTASSTITISMSFTDSCTPIVVRFSNDNTTFGDDVTYDANNPTVSWTLPAGDGSKSVWAKVRDGVGNEGLMGPQTIVLDTTKVGSPGSFGRTVSCQGTDRTVVMTWTAWSDLNFRGHRVYRSINNGPWIVMATPSGTTYTDTHKKTYDSVRFYVVGYDKAGNESSASTTVSLAKNQCS